MTIRIDGLDPTATPSRDHAVPAMKDGITVRLSIGQILDLLVGSAPGALDTLQELAAALGDDENFAATVTAELAVKLNLDGGNIGGNAAAFRGAIGLNGALAWEGIQQFNAVSRFISGSAFAPGIAFTTQNTSGLFLGGSGTVGFSIAGVAVGTYTATGLNAMAIGQTVRALGSFTVVKGESGSAGAPSFTFTTDASDGIFRPASSSIGFAIGGADVGRWSGTNFLVGATTTAGIAEGASANVGTYLGKGIIAAQNNSGAALNLSRVSSTGSIAAFFVSATNVGSISVTGSATAYNTSSDYRLPWKVGARPLVGSGEFIDGLKPYYFPEVEHAGFVAHEFGRVSPSSVTGDKDGVDEDGKPIYQAMQASSSDVMANIVAELQSLRRRVAALEDA